MISKKLKLLFEIYISFLKLGFVSFGGGYATFPLIEQEVVTHKKWIHKEKIVDIFAVSGALPGAIAINTSTFVGYSIAGIPGALVALLGNVTPSVIIVLTLSVLFTKYSSSPQINAAFRGIYPVIVGLISFAAYKIWQSSIKDKTGVIIAMLALLGSLFLNLQPIPLIILGSFAGLVICYIRFKTTKKMPPVIKNREEDN